MDRVWLDWTAPFLPAAAEWLVDRAGAAAFAGGAWSGSGSERSGASGGGGGGGGVDLGRTVCVTPGRRAGRVLLGELARVCEERGLDLVPPRTLTPGRLGDAVLDVVDPVATRVERRLAWLRALREADASAIAALLPAPPGPDDLIDWHELARTIETLHDELSGEGLSFADVPARVEGLELFAEGDRWRALEAVAGGYRAILASLGLADPGDAERVALERGAIDRGLDVVLLGVTDLNTRQRALVAALGRRVTVLVHAPEAAHGRFDDLGRPIPAAWEDVRLPLLDEQIVVAGGPFDQAQACLRDLAGLDGAYAADEITIGLGDGALAAAMVRAAEGAGLGVHAARGTPLRSTPPARLLEALGGHLADPAPARLAALARHPDLEQWVLRQTGDAGAWLTDLDRHHADHLPARITGDWPGPAPRAARLAKTHRALRRLVAPLTGGPRPIGVWCEPILAVLAEVYGSDPNPTDASTHACLAVRDVVASVHGTAETLQPACDAATAIALLLAEASSEHVAPEVRAGEIEMLGWLELHLDPAPALVLLGCNDGRIPEVVGVGPFLPDRLRRALGLMDDRRRYARDAYLMEAIHRSRRHLTVIAGRTDADEQPLPPSRLLLACDGDTLVRRVRMLCGERADGRALDLPLGSPAPGPRSRFTVPALPDDLAPPVSMAVTDFKAYLACPYRYALAHLLGLEPLTDERLELDALQFGTLAHRVLERFGADEEARDLADAARIEALLLDALAAETARRYGARPLPAVRIQAARLAQRLRAFAALQARLRSEGWRIERVELAFDGDVALDVPGQTPMPLRGKIDRIDRHEATGVRRVIDYKTGERGRTPVETHNGKRSLPRTGRVPWVDLQLPLYDWLLRRASGEPRELQRRSDGATERRRGGDDPIELAYVVLPQRPEQVRLAVAPWKAGLLAEAVDLAREVVRDIRAGRFPMNPDRHDPGDPFARICQTTVFADAGEGGGEAGE